MTNARIGGEHGRREIYDVVNANACTASSFSRTALRSATGADFRGVRLHVPPGRDASEGKKIDGDHCIGAPSAAFLEIAPIGLRAGHRGAVAASTVVATQPAAAADPWLTQPEAGYVRFTIPNAAVEESVGPVSQLVVEGNFGPSANWAQLGLSRSGANWSATIGPLDPGLYYYQITGDDTKVFKDARTPPTVGSEPEWSTFFLPGDSAALLADAPEAAGAIEPLDVPQRRRGEDRTALVWTPPGYTTDGRPYPVLYLQHGGAQGSRDWTDVGRAEQILDNLSLSGELADMIVVMGDGNVSDFSSELFDSLMPAVRDAYHVSNAKKDRALAGLSMGGGQAFEVLRDHPGEFAYVGTFGAGLFGDLSELPVQQINNHTTLFRLYVGNKTDIAYNDVFESMQQFDVLGLDYEFDGVNPDAGHNWNAWQENLIDFAPRLFHGRETGDPGFSDGHTALEERFDPPAPGTTPTPWITDDGFVTFETTTDFADANAVTVWANWAPGGSWLRVEMNKVGDRWRATVGPLDPWSYYYRLIVDRVSVKDTSNPTKVTSEPAWSTFFIPGEESRLLADVPESRRRDARRPDVPERGRRRRAKRVRLDATGLRPRSSRGLPAAGPEPRWRAELDGLGRSRAAPGRSSTISPATATPSR